MKKEKITNIIMLVLFIVCLGIAIYSGYKIIKWLIDSNKTNAQITTINKSIEISEIEDTQNTVIIEQEQEVDEENPYWDYIKMNLMNVDFNSLKNTNKDVSGWIKVNGTNINYPFVQASNNDYYLNHGFDKKYNNAGWVFLDYRNKLNNNDKNTIIYAHARKDGTMFGTLKNILKSSWQKDSNNFIVKISTEYENTLWQVFSVYQIPQTGDYLKINFNNNNDFLDFTNMLIERSVFDFQTKVSASDSILTLSTCKNTTDRIVLHAKLIKKEVK